MTLPVFTGTMFSVDSAKAIKAQSLGYLNGIHYMAPSTMGGHGDLCVDASDACRLACLGWESGQASMVKHDSDLNSVRRSRMAKVAAYMRNRPHYMARLVVAIAELIRTAKRKGFLPCVRLNGSSDIAWEGQGVCIDSLMVARIKKICGLDVAQGPHRNVMSVFPSIQFVDYTKNPRRFNPSRPLPSNYHLTFSRSESNEAKALELLAQGVNVAIVFAGALPETWNGFTVINGDEHDLRHLDPKGARGFVVGLSPKGRKAKRDTSGFVLRLAA